jgi:hypothetical protein
VAFGDGTVGDEKLGVEAMSDESKGSKSLVDKMRANTKQDNRKTTARLWRQSRKKVQKNRQKKS